MTTKTPSFNVEEVLPQLTLKEKVSLLALQDTWHLVDIERLNIPKIRLSDGPNGVRGTKFYRSVPSACFSCGTALGSTWNTELLEEAGKLMAREAKFKGTHCILGPTCNIQRGPLGGRGFESFAEDPFLSGLCTAAVINGIQSDGIMATIKHFVCNDLEDERRAINAIVSERALREVYLLPFQLATKLSNPKSYMTCYNKVNGEHVSQSKRLLTDVLRGEWGWEGLIMSDWSGVYSCEKSITAGLDLECPAPPLLRKSDSLIHQILAREIPMSVIDDRVRNVLHFIKYAAENAGLSSELKETDENNTPETSSLVKKVADETIVLLKNEGSLLPLKKDDNIAVIGPAASIARTTGGGSAALNPYYKSDVLSGIKKKLGRDVPFALGSDIELYLFDFGKVTKTPTGEPGVHVKVFDDPVGSPNRKLLDEYNLNSTHLGTMHDYVPSNCTDLTFYLTMEADFTPEVTGEYAFKELCMGTALVYINDELFIDDKSHQEMGSGFVGKVASKPQVKLIKLEAGTTYHFRIEFGSSKTFTLPNDDIYVSRGKSSNFTLGYILQKSESEFIQEAVEFAQAADKVIVCIGTSYDYESEGYDRSSMDLPGCQNELVSAVLKANKNVILVNQSGTPVSLPWIDQIPAFVQAWFNGMESGNSIVDVLYGDVNPSGKLSLTFPKKNEDNPAFLTFKSNNGHCVYGEDVFVGYRFYEKTKREPLFPFGFGLSYTSFEFSDLSVELDGVNLVATINVKNTGSVDGQEVVQLYVTPPTTTTAVERPVKELKGFKKVDLAAGESNW
ncbi:unnamed protein product [Ambrosiozyma monospora]|uniref:Unnamed protein product n=1 Tax=Ambrosiozyma monospora TaxID=43982 RepID=A0ACB5T0G0_AMBMO|nr:unnamed protein product [Ambrosiozyma monospora]